MLSRGLRRAPRSVTRPLRRRVRAGVLAAVALTPRSPFLGPIVPAHALPAVRPAYPLPRGVPPAIPAVVPVSALPAAVPAWREKVTVIAPVPAMPAAAPVSTMPFRTAAAVADTPRAAATAGATAAPALALGISLVSGAPPLRRPISPLSDPSLLAPALVPLANLLR